jgi:peptidoglycan lytic transglycosylase
MRPHTSVRARGAIPALGVLCFATSLAVLPGTAQSDDTTGTSTPASAARVADIVLGQSRLNVLSGARASLAGHLSPALAGRPVELQRRTDRGWRTIDWATTGAGGAFRFAFRPQRPSSAALRVRADASRRLLGRLNVYRRAAVSWYGPGLYGNALSCGGRLTPGTLGVAHKTLPCGARLTLRHGARIVRVRVVDRGPYVGGREFDLTAATRQALRFVGVGTVLVTR